MTSFRQTPATAPVHARLLELEAIAKVRLFTDEEQAESLALVRCFQGNRKQRRGAVSRVKKAGRK